MQASSTAHGSALGPLNFWRALAKSEPANETDKAAWVRDAGAVAAKAQKALKAADDADDVVVELIRTELQGRGRPLAGWEPSTCAVIAGLIRRAHLAGKASTANSVPLDPGQFGTLLRALADAAAHRTGRADARCEDCLAHPAGLCGPHARDLDHARRTGP